VVVTAPFAVVRAYTDLRQAGGTLLGVVGPWASLTDTLRIDGDDRLQGKLPATANGASHLAAGVVLEITESNGTVRDWIVQTVRDDLVSDTIDVSALSARVWLKERVLVRSNATLTVAGTATVSAALTALLATTEWPSWVISGTVSITPTVTYSWASLDGLAAVLNLAALADASEEAALAGDSVRFAFRRVSTTQYAIDLLTTAASGSPTLIEGKNISSFATRDDRTQQATHIYPVNSGGATLVEAMFCVRTVSSNTFDVRDWAYRDDFLAIAYDDQWVGYYAIAPDGSASVITASDASLQQITVADATQWGAGNNATVRFSPSSSLDYTLAVVDTAAAGRRNLLLSGGAWSSKINWLPNSRWDEWASATVISDWATSGGLTTNQVTGAGNVETGTYSIEFVSSAVAGACTVSEVLMPDEVVTNNGGTQTWACGFRGKCTLGTPNMFGMTVSVNGGGSFVALTGQASTIALNTWGEYTGTFTTNTATLNNRPRLRFSHSANTGNKIVVDRAWLFRVGTDDGDDEYTGNGPSVGFYSAQRALLRARADSRTYEVGVIDRTRDDPTAFPDDTFAVAQQCRIIVPSRTVDTTQQVVQVSRDLMIPTNTSVQLGALRRRLTSQV